MNTFLINQIDNNAVRDTNFIYYSKFNLDIDDPNFDVAGRIVGESFCNLLRI